MTKRFWVWLLCCAAMFGTTTNARADLPADQESVRVPGGPSYEVGVVGGAGPSSYFPGATEIFVRVQNPTSSALKGYVVVDNGNGADTLQARSDFNVAAGSSAIVHVPMMLQFFGANVEVYVGGLPVVNEALAADSEPAVRVFDAVDPFRVRTAISGSPVAVGMARVSRVMVRAAATDPVGAPILPTYVASWAGTHLVVLRSDQLLALGPEELEALSGFVLAGGTLALSIAKPEDLREALITSMLGGEPQKIPPPPVSNRWVEPPSGVARELPAPELLRFESFVGGNLEPSLFGASAPYGHGQVVLLGFELDSPDSQVTAWVQERLMELARRAFQRSRFAVVHPGALPVVGSVGPPPSGSRSTRPGGDRFDAISKVLDPNSSTQWSIGVAAILLCVYAVLAGPVAFARAKKKNRPLQALVALPILAFVTFILIVGFGFITKGVSNRANRLTFIDAAGGMEHGVARRYRAFFSPFSQTINLRAGGRTSTLEVATNNNLPYRLEVDGEGLRITGIESMPAQTIFVKEEGIASLEGGIALTRGPQDQVVITNRTKHALRAVIIHLPDHSFRFQPKLGANESIVADELPQGSGQLKAWGSNTIAKTNGLNSVELSDFLMDVNEPDLAQLWRGVDLQPQTTEWFPQGTPVVLAVVDGAWEPNGKDSGVTIEHDWMLLRVAGFGGEAP